MRISVLVGWVSAACVLAFPAQPAEWTGKGEVGVVLASGNTDAKTANVKADIAAELARWKHAVGGTAVYASDEDETTGQRWEVHEQSEYLLGERNFVFGAGRYENDRFSGFEYQATASGGVGRHFTDTDTTKLTGTIGVGYKFFHTRDTFDEDTGALLALGEGDKEGVARATVEFRHSFSASTRLIDKFLTEYGPDNTFLQNELSLQVQMTDVLAIAAGYSVRYNSDPPLGFGSSDTLTTLNLVYEVR